MRVELAVMPEHELCEGCGRCCADIGLPPFEVPNPDLGPQERGRRGLHHEVYLADLDTFMRMPAALRAEHAALVRNAGDAEDGKPCAWLDPDTKRCRHYEYRPYVCRAWVVTDRGCLAARGGSRVIWNDAVKGDDWRNPPMYAVRRDAERRAKWGTGDGDPVDPQPPWRRFLSEVCAAGRRAVRWAVTGW